MENIDKRRPVPVAGFVRGKKLSKDGNLKFRIVHQWFLLPKESTFARMIKAAKTAIVFYEKSDKKYPRIISVKVDYNGNDLREANSGDSKKITRIL